MISYANTFGGVEETNWNTSKHTEKHRSIMRETQECLVGGLFLWDNTGQEGELMGLHIHNVLYTHSCMIFLEIDYMDCRKLPRKPGLPRKQIPDFLLTFIITDWRVGLFIPSQLMFGLSCVQFISDSRIWKSYFKGKKWKFAFLRPQFKSC